MRPKTVLENRLEIFPCFSCFSRLKIRRKCSTLVSEVSRFLSEFSLWSVQKKDEKVWVHDCTMFLKYVRPSILLGSKFFFNLSPVD